MVTLNREQFEDICRQLNKRLKLDDDHTVVGIFQDNDHDELQGWAIVEKPRGFSSHWHIKYDKIYTTEELVQLIEEKENE